MDVPALVTERLVVTLAPLDAAPRLLAYAVDNAEHLRGWEPTPPDDYFTEAYWVERIARAHADFHADRSLRMHLFARADPDGPVLGQVSLSNIVRGVFQACHLGYSLDHRHVGRGLMSEALRATVHFAFDGFGLHRVMANYRPTNERSGALLRRLGFVVEGYARDYLLIDGAWRDHVLTSLTKPETG
jgi:ribosomal-protein-alanine N-acetyltransferase